MSVSYVENVADAHLAAADALARNPDAVGGRAYFVNDDEPVNCWDFIADFLDRCGAKLPARGIPARAAYWAGALQEFWAALRGGRREPSMTRFLALQLSTTHWFRNDAAKRDLDRLNFNLANEKINNQQNLDNFENTLKLKRRALEKMTVTVANDGTVSEIVARAGDLVGGGQILCRVISRERLVQAQISEENFSGVRPGLPVTLQLLGYGGQQFKGTVERVLPSADEKTKRYIAYLLADIPEERLVPGLTGEASITVDRRDNTLVIERRALLGGSVFVVRDGRAVLTPVTVGFTSLDQAEILGGLQEGDAVILESPATFRNGERVRVAK